MRSALLIFCLAACAHASAIKQAVLSGQKQDPIEELLAIAPTHPHALDVDEARLLLVSGEDKPRWTTEGEKMRLRRSGKRFTDLTAAHEENASSLTLATVPNDNWSWPKITHQSEVHSIISYLSVDRMHAGLKQLTSFFNRDYKSEYGRQSSHWLFLQVLKIVERAPPHLNLSVRKFTHPFPQSSVIARFEPPTANASAPVVIIGAHQDSLNYMLPNLPAPGADDDGSGTVTILEAFAALVESGFQPNFPVEFHWYAAEEGGLLGSQAISRYYDSLSIPVKAMWQFDMVAYTAKHTEPTVTMITTDVTNSLTAWTMELAKEYSTIKVQGAKLFPNAGSDHMSWYRHGYPAVFATEGDPMKGFFDPFIHTARDRMDLPEFEFKHAVQFARVAIGFAVELGQQMY